MGHYLFIVNPISGNKDKTQLVGRIAQLCFKYKKEYSLFYTKGKNDESVILNNIKLLQPDRVIACGGDGTINLVAKLLINSTIPLGIVPAGSANGLAVELKIPADYEQALELCFIDKYKPIEKTVAFFHELGIDTKLSDYTKNYEGTAEEIAKRFKNRGWLGLGEHQSLSPDKVEEIVKMAY